MLPGARVSMIGAARLKRYVVVRRIDQRRKIMKFLGSVGFPTCLRGIQGFATVEAMLRLLNHCPVRFGSFAFMLLTMQSSGCITKNDQSSGESSGSTSAGSETLTLTTSTASGAATTGNGSVSTGATNTATSNNKSTDLTSTGTPSASSSSTSTTSTSTGSLPKGEPDDSSSTSTDQKTSTSDDSSQESELPEINCDLGLDAIKDVNLRIAISKIAKNNNRIDEITELSCHRHNHEVESLAGLRCAKNLELLDLYGQKPGGFDELRELKQLEVLKLINTSIRPAKLDSLGRALPKLESFEVTLSETPSDAQWIGSMPRLSMLKLRGPGTTNEHIKVMGKLAEQGRLKNIHLIDTGVSDLSPLETSASQFTSVTIYGAPLSAFNSLSTFSSLYGLHIQRSEITDLKWLPVAGGLRTLWITNCENLTSLEGIRKIEGVTEVGISDNPIKDLTPLLALRKLTILKANKTPSVQNLSPLSKITWLRELYMSDSGLVDISAFASLKNLTKLHIESNMGLSDLSPIKDTTSLVDLNLSNCNLETTQHLSRLKRLQQLDLSKNKQLNDISALVGLVNLKKLNMSNCDLNDLSPLVELIKSGNSKIDDVDVSDNSQICDHPSFKELEQLSKTQEFPNKKTPGVGFKLKSSCG